MDENREPNTPVEHFLEKEMRDAYFTHMQLPEGVDKEEVWTLARSPLFYSVAVEMSKLFWLEPRDDEDDDY